ncbi:MAG: L-threonylcarbamoyladenylate synthase [Bacteroidales bacterium]|nr:L-threonylcarbamoyladenylate synthase [Bacteroidales bacterium]MDY6348528.1 L-threonylcarbamoyladenylate synthase [Bacteroidales bacterium]
MEEVIKKCVSILKEGKVILYPTDTVWGIGCDATCEEAISRIYRIKQRNEKKSMIILIDSAQRLPMYVERIPLIAWDLLSHVSRPTTFIYETACNLPQKIIHEDGTIAIRIVQDNFCKRVIKELGHPLISTSANVAGQPTPPTFDKIDPQVIAEMDYVVPQECASSTEFKPSRLIKFLDDYNFTIVRN